LAERFHQRGQLAFFTKQADAHLIQGIGIASIINKRGKITAKVVNIYHSSVLAGFIGFLKRNLPLLR
jgi:hypothetical protein